MDAKNKLFLIGNGFDLAHGLKTSYSDFLVYFYNQGLKEINKKLRALRKKFTVVASLQNTFFQFDISADVYNEISSIEELIVFAKNRNSSIIAKRQTILREVLINLNTDRWVDLEFTYFDSMRRLIQNENPNRSALIPQINSLNSQINELKTVLKQYLMTEIDTDLINSKVPHREFQSLLGNSSGASCYLNFNYTELAKIYRNDSINPTAITYIPIHGVLNDSESDIVFGYGDDVTEDYNRIQNLNINQFLLNYKSFAYSRNSKYSELMGWVKNHQFEVHVLGHSCGISDRTLLKSIFEDDNCTRIKVHFHKNIQNYLQVAYEISRHFDDNSVFREKLVPFDDSTPCPQL